MADDQKYNDKNSLVNNSRGGYPKTTGSNSSIYVSPENQTLKTAQHFVNRTNNQPQKDKGTTTKFFVEDVREHFTKPSFLGTGKDYSTWESANKRLDESINSSYMANAKDGKYEVVSKSEYDKYCQNLRKKNMKKDINITEHYKDTTKKEI